MKELSEILKSKDKKTIKSFNLPQKLVESIKALSVKFGMSESAIVEKILSSVIDEKNSDEFK